MDLLRQNEQDQGDQKGKTCDAPPQNSAGGNKSPLSCLLLFTAAGFVSAAFFPAAEFPELPLAKRDPFSDQPDRMIEPHRISKYKIKKKACRAGRK